MTEERLSRFAFAGLTILFVIVRLYFTLKFRVKESKEKKAVDQERRTNYIIRRFILLPTLALLFVMFFEDPAALRFLSIPLPESVLFAAIGLGLCAIALLIWVHLCLGREWSAGLRLQAEHRLVRSGPYAKIRHPMYTALFTLYFCLGIVSLNYAILLVIAAMIISLATRLPEEEKMLLNKFGEEYRGYIQETGRYLPKL